MPHSIFGILYGRAYSWGPSVYKHISSFCSIIFQRKKTWHLDMNCLLVRQFTQMLGLIVFEKYKKKKKKKIKMLSAPVVITM